MTAICSDCDVPLAPGEGWTSTAGRRACDPCSTRCDECGNRTDGDAPPAHKCRRRLLYGRRAKDEETRIDEAERIDSLNGRPDPAMLKFIKRVK